MRYPGVGMEPDPATALYPLLVRDAIAVFGSRADIDDASLAAFAKRRAPIYARPAERNEGDAYWVSFATALASVAPPSWMPMSALVESGVTLEGGARGLRGLIFRDHSERDRRRVLKIATLAARIMEIVATADRPIAPAEQRRIAMTMASFGLSADELAKTRPASAITFDNLEIFGELDARTRRDLLRGAWQLALVDELDPSRDVVVRGIAARLEMSAEYDTLRAEVAGEYGLQAEAVTATMAIVRDVLRAIADTSIAPWIAHLLDAAAPPSRRNTLAVLLESDAPPTVDAIAVLDASRRRQAFALAVATMFATDPPLSIATRRVAALRIIATETGAIDDAEQGIARLQQFVTSAMDTHTLRPAEPPAPPAASAPEKP
jgi:hypothetical protein